MNDIREIFKWKYISPLQSVVQKKDPTWSPLEPTVILEVWSVARTLRTTSLLVSACPPITLKEIQIEFRLINIWIYFGIHITRPYMNWNFVVTITYFSIIEHHKLVNSVKYYECYHRRKPGGGFKQSICATQLAAWCAIILLSKFCLIWWPICLFI